MTLERAWLRGIEKPSRSWNRVPRAFGTEASQSIDRPAVSEGRQVRATPRKVKPGIPRVALTPPEAAESLGCSAEFFREHVDHELRWIRRGRKRFVPLAELEQWAERSAEATL
jgi:excisionase family DNA binding protein